MLYRCIAAQLKGRVCGLGLLRPKMNGGPVCDDSAAEGGMRKGGAKRIPPCRCTCWR